MIIVYILFFLEPSRSRKRGELTPWLVSLTSQLELRRTESSWLDIQP
jgi:hypothetical protein